MNGFGPTVASRMIAAVAARIEHEADALSALDAIAGDGDHGVNMVAAFSDAARMLAETPPTHSADAFKATSAAFFETVGGASGALLGAFFAAAGKALATCEPPEAADVIHALERGADRLVTVGQSELGQKTMLDALMPAIDAARDAVDAGADLGSAMTAAAEAAQRGAEATAAMDPAAGRARYAAESSKGSADPGATTVSHIFAAWAAVLDTEVAK